MLFPQPCIQQLFSFNYKAPSPPVKTVLSAISRGIIGANRLIVARFSNVYFLGYCGYFYGSPVLTKFSLRNLNYSQYFIKVVIF